MRVDDIVRTERYFTSGLLLHLLLVDNFAGVQYLLDLLAARGIVPSPLVTQPITSDTVQVIAELAVRRDLLKLPSAQTIAPDSDVPRDVIDVVFIVSSLLIAIEAKFFSPTNLVAIRSQLATQRRALKLLEQHAGPGLTRVCHIFLSPDATVDATLLWPADTPNVGVLQWEDIAEMAERLQGADSYVAQRLRSALERYATEFGGSEIGRNWAGIERLEAILQRCHTLGKQIVVGYTDGESALIERPLQELTERRFKWDWTNGGTGKKKPQNWILGDRFAAIIVQLQGQLGSSDARARLNALL